MTRLTGIKIALGAVALVILGVGIRWDDVALRWIGIALLAGSFFMRFLNPRDRL